MAWSDSYGKKSSRGKFFQTCGYLGNWTLWGGGVSDTNCNKRTIYLEEQEKFQDSHLVFAGVDSLGLEFTACTYGKQICLQLPVSKSDMRLKGRTPVNAATIAHDRSWNERAVNVCKRSGLMERGFQEGMNVTRFNYARLTWSFQANFMYTPVV